MLARNIYDAICRAKTHLSSKNLNVIAEAQATIKVKTTSLIAAEVKTTQNRF